VPALIEKLFLKPVSDISPPISGPFQYQSLA